MVNSLSSQSEQFLAQVVASGLYPSPEAALEAAVVALREKTEEIPLIPAEHMQLVEEAIESSQAGNSRPMSDEDWLELRRLVAEIAREKGHS